MHLITWSRLSARCGNLHKFPHSNWNVSVACTEVDGICTLIKCRHISHDYVQWDYENHPALTHVVRSFLPFVGTLFKYSNLFIPLSINVSIAKYKRVRLKGRISLTHEALFKFRAQVKGECCHWMVGGPWRVIKAQSQISIFIYMLYMFSNFI
jgi:hypothetical protein